MDLKILSFGNGDTIPSEYVLGAPSDEGHGTFGGNRSPHLRWSGTPEGTQSLAVIMYDADAPTVPDDVNQEGRTVPRDLPRADFHHWVLVDIPATTTELKEGADSDAVTPHGKPPGATDHGLRGTNDYTSWFAGDKDMEGTYAGYDGPGPPWNDERVHNYHFTVYALDVPTLGMSVAFGAADALAAMEGRVLDQASWSGTYAINPEAGA